MESTARLYRRVIDDVLHRTQEDIFIGHEGHVAASIVHDLQVLWESKLAAAQKESLERVKAASAPPDVAQNDPYTSATTRQNASSKTSASAPSKEKGATVKLENPYELASLKRAQDSSLLNQPTKKRKISPTPPNEKKVKKEKREKDDLESDDSSLGSDTDSDEAGNEEFETDNLVLCQFHQKLKHHKGRWKCPLRDGIMHLHGRDYVFHECSGDFRWS